MLLDIERGQTEHHGRIAGVHVQIHLEIIDDAVERSHLAGDLKQPQQGGQVVAVHVQTLEIRIEGGRQVAGLLADHRQTGPGAAAVTIEAKCHTKGQLRIVHAAFLQGDDACADIRGVFVRAERGGLFVTLPG